MARRLAFWLGGGLTSALVLTALLGAVWTPYPIDAVAVVERLQAPSPLHPFGTDQLGRDMLSLLMAGAGTSLLVAAAAVAAGAGFGVPLGLLAAFRGGVADEAVMRLSDLALAFPALLTAAMIAATYGPGVLDAVVAIAIFNVPVFARLARSLALPLTGRAFVQAGYLAGKDALGVVVVHVLPNVASLLVVQAAIQLAFALLAEASLSYLGLGVQPPGASWGRMLGEAQTYMRLAPHVVLFPGLAIVLAVMGLNLLGDGLRDRLDPRLWEGS